jgi:hypothetical protein
MKCDCQWWGRSDLASEALGNGHHVQCNAFKPNVRALDLLDRLVKGIEFWGSQEDGIIDEVWDAYAEARAILGRPVSAATPDGKDVAETAERPTVMLTRDGKAYRCDCGENLFQKVRPGFYRCNGCRTEYWIETTDEGKDGAT